MGSLNDLVPAWAASPGVRLAATACNAASVSWGLLMLVLSHEGFRAEALAVYAAAYGAVNLWLIFRGAGQALAAGRAPWIRAGNWLLNASPPPVFLALALADGGALLEWVGAALMVLPALLNGLAVRAALERDGPR